MSPIRAARREKFQKLGQSISKLTDRQRAWRDHLGQHEFEIKCRPVQDPEVNSHFPDAPALKTQQWERTIR